MRESSRRLWPVRKLARTGEFPALIPATLPVAPMLFGIRYVCLLLFRQPARIVTAIGALVLAGCGAIPIERKGPPQEQIVKQDYPMGMQSLRSAILEKFGHASRSLPMPYREMKVFALEPPQYPSGWLLTYVDPGGFLEPYKREADAQKLHDLLIEDPTGDLYWVSEYAAGTGPVKFHCGFLLHFTEKSDSTTEVQVYEKVPTVWAGERWGVSRHGIGFGKFHDIRFVEPTVKDRLDVLHLINKIVAGSAPVGPVTRLRPLTLVN